MTSHHPGSHRAGADHPGSHRAEADHAFDREYWDRHWDRDPAETHPSALAASPPNPHLLRQVADLAPGTALEAGCGAGAEAIWLAARGWRVTAADIAEQALALAARRAADEGVADRVEWVRADLSTWQPGATYDLVTTFYAHPAMPQLEFYDRIAAWVAPGGTLLVVGHLHHDHGHGHGHSHEDGGPPTAATVHAADVAARLDPSTWDVVTAEESRRDVPRGAGSVVTLHDAVVRATRRR